MKKGKFLFIENTKDEKAEYQIFVLFPEKTKNDKVDEIFDILPPLNPCGI